MFTARKGEIFLRAKEILKAAAAYLERGKH
jgi:hypothetical protein